MSSHPSASLMHLLCVLSLLLLTLTHVTQADTNNNPHSDSSPYSLIHPFRINVSDGVLSTLQRKLELTRLPSELEDVASNATLRWSAGTDVEYIATLVRYWREQYKWREREASMNQLSHFITTIDGLKIHFVHHRAQPQTERTQNLLFIHGWPGSFLECTRMLGRLTKGDGQINFNVVCPSLPGYGFSDAPRVRGYDPKKIALILGALMSRLGYERYVVQGGDWGGVIGTAMAQYNQHVIGLHLNFAPFPPPVLNFNRGVLKGIFTSISTLLDIAFAKWRLDPREVDMVQAAPTFMWSETGYFHQQATKPMTLGVALHDSPAGLASWIVEKYRTWCDCDGDVGQKWSMDEVLDFIMVYYVTDNIVPSIRLYYETTHPAEQQSIITTMSQVNVDVVTGFAAFPREPGKLPASWLSKYYNLQSYTYMDKGGHFAAWEQPELLANDIMQFVKNHVVKPTQENLEKKQEL